MEKSQETGVLKRRAIFLIVGLAAFGTGRANAESEQRGGFIAIDLQFTSLNRGLGIIFGLRGGYQTEGGTLIGAGIYDLLNGTPFPNAPTDKSGRVRRTKMHFAGVILGQEFGSEDSLRTRISALVGLGDVSAYYGKKRDSSDQSFYLTVQPRFLFSLSGPGKFRPQVGAGWRLHSGVNTSGTSNAQLGGAFLSGSGAFTSL